MSENYIIHSHAGGERPGHKYSAREWVNGAWRYVYDNVIKPGHSNTSGKYNHQEMDRTEHANSGLAVGAAAGRAGEHASRVGSGVHANGDTEYSTQNKNKSKGTAATGHSDSTQGRYGNYYEQDRSQGVSGKMNRNQIILDPKTKSVRRPDGSLYAIRTTNVAANGHADSTLGRYGSYNEQGRDPRVEGSIWGAAFRRKKR